MIIVKKKLTKKISILRPNTLDLLVSLFRIAAFEKNIPDKTLRVYLTQLLDLELKKSSQW